MFFITVTVRAEGEKKSIYLLKEEVLRVASQHNCSCRVDLGNNKGVQESVSADFQSVVEVSPGDIVDLTLTGDEKYELLVQKEEEDKRSES
uniref:Uncharacterized protein n=1 Tax=viral metagenome TaxID=1070528 RepID=A0A6M3IR52_9ZZZZ